MSFAENLLQSMKSNGLSFSDLAKKSGVSKSTLHGWTTGRRVQDLKELQRVAQVLEISFHELVFGEPDPYEANSDEFMKELFSGDVRVTIHKLERPRSK
jgi:transcriptional regulator with XRE-family HTH domain